jgi:hypothetical protein
MVLAYDGAQYVEATRRSTVQEALKQAQTDLADVVARQTAVGGGRSRFDFRSRKASPYSCTACMFWLATDPGAARDQSCSRPAAEWLEDNAPPPSRPWRVRTISAREWLAVGRVAEFLAIAHSIVWCSVASVGPSGPRCACAPVLGVDGTARGLDCDAADAAEADAPRAQPVRVVQLLAPTHDAAVAGSNGAGHGRRGARVEPVQVGAAAARLRPGGDQRARWDSPTSSAFAVMRGPWRAKPCPRPSSSRRLGGALSGAPRPPPGLDRGAAQGYGGAPVPDGDAGWCEQFQAAVGPFDADDSSVCGGGGQPRSGSRSSAAAIRVCRIAPGWRR